MGSNPRNSEFPAAFKWDKPDEVGRLDDEVNQPDEPDDDPNKKLRWVSPQEWQEMQRRLMERLNRRGGRKEQTEIPPGATHLMPAGHTFWFAPESGDDELGWETKSPVYLRRHKRGKFRQSEFEVVAPEKTLVFQYGSFKEEYLTPGTIIYTTRVKKLKKTTY